MTPISKEEIENIKNIVRDIRKKAGEHNQFSFSCVVNGMDIRIGNGEVHFDDNSISFAAFDDMIMWINWDKIYSFVFLNANTDIV